MYKENAEFLGGGAEYVDGKVLLKGLTESEIAQFTGEVNRIDQLGLNPVDDPALTGLSTAELSAIMSQLAAQDPNEELGVLSVAQGKWLYANHPEFMPEDTA